MKVYILRHAQTDMNKEKLIQGRLDIPINDEGVVQAKNRRDAVIKSGLSFDVIFTSPLERAIQTTEIVSGVNRSEFIIDERLAELCFGEIEGLNYRSLPFPQSNFFDSPKDYIPAKGGETFEELESRLTSFFTDLTSDDFNRFNYSSKDENDFSILITSHGTVMHSILKNLLELDYDDFWTPPASNCSLFEVQLSNQEYKLIGAYDSDGKLEPDMHKWTK